MNGEFAAIVQTASVWILPVIFAITLHEAAHGFAALRYGDDTALRLGRVSLNPLRHVDLFGTIIIPALLLLSGTRFLFGYAKPVPVNFARLNHPKRDMIWVAAAGPATNLFLAWISALLLYVTPYIPDGGREWLILNLVNSVQINVVLAVFNMIPLPPLDGGRVAVGLLPTPLAKQLARVERFGLVILIAALFLLPYLGARMGLDLNIFPWLVGRPAQFLINLIATITGQG